ncbi:MAG: hypothetical protein ABR526_12115 [Chthoniobacterales bacterium]
MNESKFTKDQIQKMVLSGIGFVVLVYIYFSFFLGPLNRNRETMERTIADLQTKVGASKGEMQKATNLERQATEATARFAAYKALSPEGAPIAWFPPRIKLFFVNQKIDRSNARLEGSGPYKEPELVEWMRYSWLVDLPQTDFATAGHAIAELENAEPLLSVSKLTIKAVADDPQFQTVNLTANTTILKR